MLSTLKGAISRHPRLFDLALRTMPPRSEAERFFASLGEGVRFIQIGANDGLRWDPLRRSIIKQNWRGLALEPLPGVFPLLKRNYAHVPNVHCLQLAVGSHDETLTFWTMSADFLQELQEDVQLYYVRKSSFNRQAVESALTKFDDSQLEYLAARGHVPKSDLCDAITPVDVKCLTVNSLVMQHWKEETLDLIAIDAEGHEAQIIPAIDLSVVRPRCFFYEAFHLEDTDRIVVENHLQRAGYSIRHVGGDAIALRME